MLSCGLCGYHVNIYSNNPIYNVMLCYVCKDKMPVCKFCAEKIIVSRVTNKDCLCKSCGRDKKIVEVLGD